MNPISIVVPDGSMQEPVMKLFARAGLPVAIAKKRAKVGIVNVNWIKQIAFQRPQEIPQYLQRGHFDIAVVGEDWIADWGYNFPILLKLPIGRSGNKPVKIVVAVKQSSEFKNIEDLPEGCEVATEYVQLAQQFFSKKNREDIVVTPSYGNTERKVEFGASAVIDITESGDSLRENQLRVMCEIMESCTVIVANPQSLSDKTKFPYIDCLVRLINGAYQATKYVLMVANVPKKSLSKAIKIMGGLKGASRSIIRKNWFSLQSIILKIDEQDIIFKLLQIGVTDIVVVREIPLIMS